MTWHHISDTTPRAAKEYTCELCGLRIRKGARHIARRGIDDEGRVTARMHAVCESRTHSWYQSEWECCDENDFYSCWLNLPLIDLENVP